MTQLFKVTFLAFFIGLINGNVFAQRPMDKDQSYQVLKLVKKAYL